MMAVPELKNKGSASDGTPQNKIYIRQLEARITHLKVLSKNFDNREYAQEITEDGSQFYR